MDAFSGLDNIVRTDYPLAKDTWYRLGGPADYFIRPENVDQLKQVVARCNENSIPIYVMGFGSNLLVSDQGVRGAVIKLDADQFTRTQFEGEQLTAGAGADMRKLVRACVEEGLSGLEALTGIPSSVGGAVKMNAGGRFKPELVFDYRQTNITAKFILGASLRLNPADPEQVMRTVKEVWIYKENSQPSLKTKNSGCIFKNPKGVSAGALIDRAGLKGLKVGGAVVSDKHANFILAEEGCTSKDVLRLIDAIKERVREQFDTELELEIEIWE
jgi:UDP-N-acetylmuramate dehydrogenase